jgi:23S rRNA (uracil1939-C5)-methyltransferase
MDVSSHVECVCLLDKKDIKQKDYIEIGVDAEDYYRIKGFEKE